MNPDENASKEQKDLLGQICPYPVMNIIRAVDNMQSGRVIKFVVDDPLAVKSVPEELEEYDDVVVRINRCDGGWEIEITRS